MLASAAQRAAPAGRGDRGPLTARRSSSRTLPRRALASSRAFVCARRRRGRAGVRSGIGPSRRGTAPVRPSRSPLDLSALETLDNAEKQDKGPSPSPHPARHDPSPPPRARADPLTPPSPPSSPPSPLVPVRAGNRRSGNFAPSSPPRERTPGRAPGRGLRRRERRRHRRGRPSGHRRALVEAPPGPARGPGASAAASATPPRTRRPAPPRRRRRRGPSTSSLSHRPQTPPGSSAAAAPPSFALPRRPRASSGRARRLGTRTRTRIPPRAQMGPYCKHDAGQPRGSAPNRAGGAASPAPGGGPGADALAESIRDIIRKRSREERAAEAQARAAAKGDDAASDGGEKRRAAGDSRGARTLGVRAGARRGSSRAAGVPPGRASASRGLARARARRARGSGVGARGRRRRFRVDDAAGVGRGRADRDQREIPDGERGGRARDGADDFTRVEESGTKLNSATYANYTKAEKWSARHGVFFQALRQFGTDFSLIQRLFPGRTRRQIKKKYLAEDKLNPERVEEAVRNLNPDVALYKNLIDVLRAPESAAPDADENAKAGGALAARGETDGATNVARAVLDGPRDLPIEGVAGVLPSNEGEERTETDGAATRGRPTAKAKITPPPAAAAAEKEKERERKGKIRRDRGRGRGEAGRRSRRRKRRRKPATEAGRGARGRNPRDPDPGGRRARRRDGDATKKATVAPFIEGHPVSNARRAAFYIIQIHVSIDARPRTRDS